MPPSPARPNNESGLRAALLAFRKLFQARNVDSPALSAEILLAHALGIERNELLKRLIVSPDAPLCANVLTLADTLALRRAGGEPVAHITGVKEFYGRDFQISPATLIPRPETELLIDLALEFARQKRFYGPTIFADFGTGSGCIGVTLALELPRWRGLALDNIRPALKMCAQNSARLGARNLAALLGDFHFAPLCPSSLDLLASNPPYVSELEYRALDHEVRSFEPKSALVPQSGQGAAGLEDLSAVSAQGARLLKPGGLLLMECGCAQGEELLALLIKQNSFGLTWSDMAIKKDLAGLNRVLRAVKY